MATTNSEKLSALTSLKTRALKAYATKDFPLSADLYAQACELQKEINGESNPNNAHLLYLYGRSLYRVAIDKSDVLGVPTDDKKDKPANGKGKDKDRASISEEPEDKADKLAEAKKAAGLFQFHGDENFDDGDDEEAEGAEEEGDEEDDEMNAAWEVLDLARVFFEKQLAASAEDKETTAETTAETATEDKETAAENKEEEKFTIPKLNPQQIKDTKTMLADVYDLLGEVSLESENFPQATKDFDSALTLKTELYPVESTLISEAEFKMALALEFSVTGDMSSEDAAKLREAAAGHVEKSIESCRARIAAEQAKIDEAAAKDGEDVKGKGKATESKESKQIEEVKEMIAELEQRAHDLRNPPAPEEIEGNEQLNGLLGQLLGGGSDPLLSKEALEEAMKSAKDLSGLVRKKAKSGDEEVNDSDA
ncbi:hypothetical protein K440DRAFT_3203 [Wilcoxina mikolae CBS 423.85]|nr:hypothetical protein K440DRAFT_3203 [Wilcoxina mikolae CBS 423.85]